MAQVSKKRTTLLQAAGMAFYQAQRGPCAFKEMALGCMPLPKAENATGAPVRTRLGLNLIDGLVQDCSLSHSSDKQYVVS